jgi:hypothetical protein
MAKQFLSKFLTGWLRKFIIVRFALVIENEGESFGQEAVQKMPDCEAERRG